MTALEIHNHSNEEKRVVRTMFDPSNKLSDEQIMMFLHVAKERQLDPRLKQICAVPKYNKNTGSNECVIITQIDGFRLIAERTQRYAPGKDTQFLYNDKGGLIGAKVFVKKMTPDGTWHEMSATAFLQEYNAGTMIWKKMPHVMLEKCAEARALRRAFPGELSGLYSDDEMEQALVEVPVKKDEPKQVEAKEEPKRISAEMVDKINGYLEGKEDIKRQMLNLCMVNGVEDIREPQLDACRAFIEAKNKKEKVA